MINVGVIGHTGRTGKPLMELLKGHPECKITYTESRKEGATGDFGQTELFFLALPDKDSDGYLPRLSGKRVIDLSSDHRTSPGWVYGLPEFRREGIAEAQRLTNPGCYPTAIILGLAPIAGQIKNVCIAATSGISGAGQQPTDVDNFRTYKEGMVHKHIPEIEKTMGIKGVIFVPEVIETVDRGIAAKIFAEYSGDDSVEQRYRRHFDGERFVRVKGQFETIETKGVIGTNFCDIKPMQFGTRVVVISAIDNIIKGAVGQAVQNFNLMYGFPEITGLEGLM